MTAPRSYLIHDLTIAEVNRVMKTLQADISGHGSTATVNNTVVSASGSVSGGSSIANVSGTVTMVSVATANGFQGTVATPSTTPIITLQTSVTGMLKGAENAIVAATPGLDYSAPTGVWYDVANLGYETTLAYTLTSPARTLTITPTGASWRAWVNGVQYTFVGPQAITHAATQGLWFIYVDNTGTIVSTQTAWNILDTAPIALIYYDSITPDAFFFDERHHHDTPVEWHQSQHFAIGTFIKNPSSDFILGSYVLNQGNNAGVQWSLTSGTSVDEDIEILCSPIPAAGPYYITVKSGASGNFTRSIQVRPYISNGGSPDVLQYNQFTGSTWQMSNVPNTDYVNYYLFATTGYDSTDQILVIPGQAVFTTLASAQNETVSSINLTGFPALEFVPIYQITLHVNTGTFSNHGSCAISAVTKIFGTRTTLSETTPTFTNPMTTLGDMISGDVGGAPTRVIGSTSASLAVLSQTGTGVASNPPAWILPSVSGTASTIALRDVSGGLSAQGFDATTVGSGFKTAEGANAKQGTSTLALGTVTVANTSVTATSRVFLTRQGLNASTALGELAVSSRIAGTSFTITSYTPAAVTTLVTDLSTIAWEIFEVG